jgi:hypothetical protein
MSISEDYSFDWIIDNFKLCSNTHPNLSHCWISYLELKKRHYNSNTQTPELVNIIEQSKIVLNKIKSGHCDLKKEDIKRLILYSMSI